VGLCSFFEIRSLTGHLFKKLAAGSTQATQLAFASQPIKSSAKALYLKNSGKEGPASPNEVVEINRPPP
jgi:hypothetical protein